MDAIFKSLASPKNKIIKTFASSTKTFDVYFLDTVNTTTPQLIVTAALTDIEKFNYIEIAALGKMYFIRDIISLDAERVQISAAIDVLSTYKNDVLSAQVLTARGTKNINVFIPDNRLKNSTRGISQIKTLQGGEWLPTITTTTNGVVVTTFGGGAANV